MWRNIPVIPAVAAPQVLGHGAACIAPLLLNVAPTPRVLHDHLETTMGLRRICGAVWLLNAIQHMGLGAILKAQILINNTAIWR